MAERLHFDMIHSPSNPDDRQARALEYIAHYLDLIEGHLARAANPGPMPSPIERIEDKLSTLVNVISNKK
jgi:hypothetical protein